MQCWKCKNSNHENGCNYGYRWAAGAAGRAPLPRPRGGAPMTVGRMMAAAGWETPPATPEELDRLTADAMRACFVGVMRLLHDCPNARPHEQMRQDG